MSSLFIANDSASIFNITCTDGDCCDVAHNGNLLSMHPVSLGFPYPSLLATCPCIIRAMKTRDFHYDLPDELIAQKPCDQRSASRLLHLTRTPNSVGHRQFKDLPDLLNENDLLVFNDTRVIPARLYGHKSTGGKVEILIERLIDEHRCLAHVRASKTPKPDSIINITSDAGSDYALKVEGRQDDLFILTNNGDNQLTDIMQQAGHMPLPPYITRDDEEFDFERYQTVYSKKPGAVAAPTAGLHFDDEILGKIADKGVLSTHVTLHVGAGTFQPVRTENIEDHLMHSEYLEVSQRTVDLCNQTKARGGRVIAVGTTAVRCLETASQSRVDTDHHPCRAVPDLQTSQRRVGIAHHHPCRAVPDLQNSQEGELAPYTGETDIFITPGYEFRAVDAMITNFHLPESTLLMLVSAFAGREFMLDAYAQAVAERYRFFSYGDCMFIS